MSSTGLNSLAARRMTAPWWPGAHQVELAPGHKVKRESPLLGQPDDLGDLVRPPLLLDEDLMDAPRGAAEGLDDRVQPADRLHFHSIRLMMCQPYLLFSGIVLGHPDPADREGEADVSEPLDHPLARIFLFALVRRYAVVGHPVDPGILVIGVLLDQGVEVLALLGPLEDLLGQLLGFSLAFGSRWAWEWTP